jgi:hypothetical protein
MISPLQSIFGAAGLLLLFWAAGAAALAPLPGPPSLPYLGSLGFLGAAITGQVVPELIRCRREYGPIFLVKTGPVTQVNYNEGEKKCYASVSGRASLCPGWLELQQPFLNR